MSTVTVQNGSVTPLVLGSQKIPSFAQLFFYDLDYTTNIQAD